MRATIKGILISTVVMSLSGAVFAQGAGGGGGGGTAGGTRAGQGGTGMSTPNSNGATGSTSGASGSSTMGKSSDMSHKKMRRRELPALRIRALIDGGKERLAGCGGGG